MESYEKRSDEAESQARRLEDEAERVERLIEETRSDVQSKEGQLPGVAAPSEDDAEDASSAPERASDADEESNETSAD